jgi:pimeloyl-ACP methyl ester carboxylesterase
MLAMALLSMLFAIPSVEREPYRNDYIEHRQISENSERSNLQSSPTTDFFRIDIFPRVLRYNRVPSPSASSGSGLQKMPTIKVNGVNLFYKESGSGPETIVFSHGLLMDHTMFEPQRAAFEKQYRVIAYDHRAQGQSEDIGRGYDMSTIADDAALLIRALKAAPCHFAGLSMGGFAGMRVAAHHPELIRTLTLMNTTATKEKLLNRIKYALLAQMVKIFSPAPFTPIAVKELFGRSTRQDPKKRAMLDVWTAKLRARPKNIAPSLLAVMNRRQFRAEEMAAIRCPTLVITGEDDTAQPPRNSASLIAGIRDAHHVSIPGAGHSSCLETPEAVTAAMQELFQSTKKAVAN